MTELLQRAKVQFRELDVNPSESLIVIQQEDKNRHSPSGASAEMSPT